MEECNKASPIILKLLCKMLYFIVSLLYTIPFH